MCKYSLKSYSNIRTPYVLSLLVFLHSFLSIYFLITDNAQTKFKDKSCLFVLLKPFFAHIESLEFVNIPISLSVFQKLTLSCQLTGSSYSSRSKTGIQVIQRPNIRGFFFPGIYQNVIIYKLCRYVLEFEHSVPVFLT